MLEGCQVRNFKSLKNVEAEFGDVTVLIGRNNSGKSALLESLLFLKAASNETPENIESVSTPDFLGQKLNDSDKTLYKGENSQADSVRIAVQVDLSSTYGPVQNLHSENSEILPNEISSMQIGGQIGRDGWVPVCDYPIDHSDDKIISVVTETSDTSLEVTMADNSTLSSDKSGFMYCKRGNGNLNQLISDMRNTLRFELNNMKYISEVRDIQQEEAEPQDIGFVGEQGQEVVSMLNRLLSNERAKFEEVQEVIRDITPGVERLEARENQGLVSSGLSDETTESMVNLVSSGSGIRRILPIIVQLAVAENNTIVIEEPGLGLYPRAQERVIEYIGEVVQAKDVQVIFTTHSLPMIWKVQEVLDSSIGHALEFKKEDGQSVVNQAPFERMGEFEELYNPPE